MLCKVSGGMLVIDVEIFQPSVHAWRYMPSCRRCAKVQSIIHTNPIPWSVTSKMHLHHAPILQKKHFDLFFAFWNLGIYFASPFMPKLCSIIVTPCPKAKTLTICKWLDDQNSILISSPQCFDHLDVLQNLLLEFPLDLLSLLVGIRLAVEVKESSKVELWCLEELDFADVDLYIHLVKLPQHLTSCWTYVL